MQTKNKIKILFLGPEMTELGGIATVLKTFYDFALRQNEPWSFYKTTSSSRFIFWRFFKIGWKALIFPLYLIYKKPEVVCIHTASYRSFYRKVVYFLISKIFRKKVVLHIHPANFLNFYEQGDKLRQKVVLWCLKKSDRIFVLTKSLQKEYQKLCADTPVSVIPNPIDFTQYQNVKRKTFVNNWQVLYLGRFSKEKGINEIMQALPEWVRLCPDVQFVFAGAGQNKVDFENKIKKLGLLKHVQVIPWADEKEKKQLLRESRLLLLPSHTEGVPMSLLEAMASGLPVIATPVGGIPDVFKEGTHGYYVKPKDYKDLTQKVVMLLHDDGECEKISKKAFESNLSEYDIFPVAKKINQLMEKMFTEQHFKKIFSQDSSESRFLKMYYRFPVFIQNFLCSLRGWLIIYRRYSNNYVRIEKQVFARDDWSEKEIYALQCQRLQRLVQHASRNVPYYKKFFKNSGIQPSAIQTPEDLKKLPVIDRQTVQENRDDFLCANLDEYNKVSLVNTSGSTGTSLAFPLTLEAEQELWAVCWRYRKRFGVDHHTPYAHFFAKRIVDIGQNTPPFWRVNYPGRQTFFSLYHMQQKNLHYYVAELNRKKFPWIAGYPSALSLVADYMIRTGDKLTYRPRIVTTASENLMPHQKIKIEEAFNARCCQHYAMTESVAQISECQEGNLHIDEDFGIVEVLKNTAGFGELVCTGFANEAFVLMRYKVGDLITLNDGGEQCLCPHKGRLVRSIDGRLDDYILTSDGRAIGRFDHFLKKIKGVRECQIVQKKMGEIILNIVPSKKFSDEESHEIILEAKSYLGQTMDVKVKVVDCIERTKAGKLRFVRSEINKDVLNFKKPFRE